MAARLYTQFFEEFVKRFTSTRNLLLHENAFIFLISYFEALNLFVSTAVR